MDYFVSLHPIFVHFPIALFLAYTFLEITGIIFKNEAFTKSAYLVLMLALIGAIAAVLTGDQAAQAAERLSDMLEDTDINIPLGAIDKHEEYANITLWYIAGNAALRTYLLIKKKFTGWLKYSFILLTLAGSFLIYQTALLGGKLVYRHGVGTDLLKPENVIEK